MLDENYNLIFTLLKIFIRFASNDRNKIKYLDIFFHSEHPLTHFIRALKLTYHGKFTRKGKENVVIPALN
jgi:hypothetical protein